MNIVIKKILTPFYNIGLALKSLSWKRDASIVLVGSWFGEKFADNSRFLFQYLSDNMEQLNILHVVWVTRSDSVVEQVRKMGYEIYLMDSEESIKFHKTAKYHIICNSSDFFSSVQRDIKTEYSFGAKRINLWHGVVGFKGVGMSSQGYLTRKKNHPVICGIQETLHKWNLYRRFVEQLGGWGDCYYLSTSSLKTKMMIKSFQLPQDNYIETGFPRVCGTVRLLPVEEQVMEVIKSYKKTIIYLPTFRGKGGTFDFNEASEGVREYLEENNVLWIQKGHSASKDKINKLVQNGNIVNLPNEFDINTIIPHISLMVSDYSSAMGDAMYYYKPLVFYVPDFDEYRTVGRGFQRDPDEIMCGPKAKKTNELVQFIDESLMDSWHPDSKYIKVRNEYYTHKKTLNEIWQDIIAAVR